MTLYTNYNPLAIISDMVVEDGNLTLQWMGWPPFLFFFFGFWRIMHKIQFVTTNLDLVSIDQNWDRLKRADLACFCNLLESEEKFEFCSQTNKKINNFNHGGHSIFSKEERIFLFFIFLRASSLLEIYLYSICLIVYLSSSSNMNQIQT